MTNFDWAAITREPQDADSALKAVALRQMAAASIQTFDFHELARCLSAGGGHQPTDLQTAARQMIEEGLSIDDVYLASLNIRPVTVFATDACYPIEFSAVGSLDCNGGLLIQYPFEPVNGKLTEVDPNDSGPIDINCVVLADGTELSEGWHEVAEHIAPNHPTKGIKASPPAEPTARAKSPGPGL